MAWLAEWRHSKNYTSWQVMRNKFRQSSRYSDTVIRLNGHRWKVYNHMPDRSKLTWKLRKNATCFALNIFPVDGKRRNRDICLIRFRKTNKILQNFSTKSIMNKLILLLYIICSVPIRFACLFEQKYSSIFIHIFSFIFVQYMKNILKNNWSWKQSRLWLSDKQIIQ